MTEISRRSFVSTSTAALATSRALGANDRVRLGAIGAGGRGSHLMREANKCENIEWVAVSDAWDLRRDKATQIIGNSVEKYADYRKLLDRKDIDAVLIATWDNTHAQIAIDACRAGKDIYVEKPITSEPGQGPPMVRAVRENRRIVQTGVQQRSTEHFREAKERFFDSGLIGEVHMVRTIWNANGGYIYRPPEGMERKPEGLDWNACLGSLPKTPWDPMRYFNRFAYMELGCGQTGGLFVHMIDVAQWYLGITKPGVVVSLGGIYQYDDGRNTPDNVNVIAEYPEKLTVTFEASVTDMVPAECDDIVFLGSGGRLHIFRYGYRFLPKGTKDLRDQVVAKGVPDQHMRNFIDCVRSRRQPNASIEQGHYGAMACHLANLAWKEKRPVKWSPEWDI
ncbi:MAG: Gfo/Idh/MocA family oxidoreductase [Bryobacterales bacterium]|nr:Gfo/Idh/MocA family oxidoreductase [Bryobacterales bacterium]